MIKKIDNFLENKIYSFLKDIEKGKISIFPIDIPQEIYAGNVNYNASNGWNLTVFNDCNDWDYLDSVTIEDITIKYEELPNKILNYRPSKKVAWEKYGIPGYLKFRCLRCGENFKNWDTSSKPFICDKCR